MSPPLLRTQRPRPADREGPRSDDQRARAPTASLHESDARGEASRAPLGDFASLGGADPVQLSALAHAISDVHDQLRPAADVSSPVQQKASGAGGGGSVREHAARGVAGGGGRLPHYERIQSAFGRHDVAGVKAHVGGAAKGAAEAMGASAYATGDHVAFSTAPDLHTSAHEAAHVIQQRAGVHVASGVGKAGDAYERHADAVADAVVQGKSAASLLAGHASGGSASPAQGAVVQRLARLSANDTAAFYTKHLASDWAGRAILTRYMTGGGDWIIKNDPSWTAYMKGSRAMQESMKGILIQKAQALRGKVGRNLINQPPMSMEMENGEGAVGYEYLHGTNKKAGDFQMAGTATVAKHAAGGGVSVQFVMAYTWNDMIDPNFAYDTDTLKAKLAIVMSVGQAKDYRIAITWPATTRLDLDATGKVVRRDGWPWVPPVR